MQPHQTLTSPYSLADDLVETFLNIALPRFPAFDANELRARLREPDTHPAGPVEHPLLALAMAFGARFSDHPAVEADRQELTVRDQQEHGIGNRPPRSRIIQLLVMRAREVIEVHKCHRVRHAPNALVLVLAESLFGRE